MDDRSPLLEREEDESEDDTEAGHFRRVHLFPSIYLYPFVKGSLCVFRFQSRKPLNQYGSPLL